MRGSKFTEEQVVEILREAQGGMKVKAVKGVKTVAQIAADNNLHTVQVTQWKTRMGVAFSGVWS